MLDSFLANRSLVRLLSFLVLISAILTTTACNGLFGTHKKVQIPQLLTPLSESDKTQLLNEINRLAATRSLHGKVDIQFEDTSFAEAGIAEKYRQADGTVTVQRPGKIYLVIQFAFVDIAQMASDGEHFRVAILRGDEKYKRFVKGTNNATYPKLDTDASGPDPKKKRQPGEQETVSALSNLRPQHLTDALMIRPARNQDGFVYSLSEFFQEEPDIRLQLQAKGTRIVRGYYLLEEFSPVSAGEAKLSRRFWFDRVKGIRLARLQTFNERGLLTTDVTYWDEKPFGEAGQMRLPSRIEITRPHDQYKLSISYQTPAAVELDRDYRPEAFVLENKWQLPEVDLDAHPGKSND